MTYFLKFFLKCNQNCLKNAGNPRDMRRFQVLPNVIAQHLIRNCRVECRHYSNPTASTKILRRTVFPYLDKIFASSVSTVGHEAICSRVLRMN
ncbi:hypothetical protein ANCDUO_04459 [Ancylostoma duodenale]|uniref:Transcription factor COE DNA-binding domain-containing protein n=1 Tax=Ancylostoma duodenale TaxID=51022 RepID=A0A0C2D6H1_9BILA|nr:hypothetical protein ANCDUO_04459 [Ancylostoma duodenale]